MSSSTPAWGAAFHTVRHAPGALLRSALNSVTIHSTAGSLPAGRPQDGIEFSVASGPDMAESETRSRAGYINQILAAKSDLAQRLETLKLTGLQGLPIQLPLRFLRELTQVKCLELTWVNLQGRPRPNESFSFPGCVKLAWIQVTAERKPVALSVPATPEMQVFLLGSAAVASLSLDAQGPRPPAESPAQGTLIVRKCPRLKEVRLQQGGGPASAKAPAVVHLEGSADVPLRLSANLGEGLEQVQDLSLSRVQLEGVGSELSLPACHKLAWQHVTGGPFSVALPTFQSIQVLLQTSPSVRSLRIGVPSPALQVTRGQARALHVPRQGPRHATVVLLACGALQSMQIDAGRADVYGAGLGSLADVKGPASGVLRLDSGGENKSQLSICGFEAVLLSGGPGPGGEHRPAYATWTPPLELQPCRWLWPRVPNERAPPPASVEAPPVCQELTQLLCEAYGWLLPRLLFPPGAGPGPWCLEDWWCPPNGRGGALVVGQVLARPEEARAVCEGYLDLAPSPPPGPWLRSAASLWLCLPAPLASPVDQRLRWRLLTARVDLQVLGRSGPDWRVRLGGAVSACLGNEALHRLACRVLYTDLTSFSPHPRRLPLPLRYLARCLQENTVEARLCSPVAAASPRGASAQLLQAAFQPHELPGAEPARLSLLRTMRFVYAGDLEVRPHGTTTQSYAQLVKSVKSWLSSYSAASSPFPGESPTLAEPQWGPLQVWLEPPLAPEAAGSSRALCCLLAYLFPLGGWWGLYGGPPRGLAPEALLPPKAEAPPWWAAKGGEGPNRVVQAVQKALQDCLCAWVEALLRGWLQPGEWEPFYNWLDQQPVSLAGPDPARDLVVGVSDSLQKFRPEGGRE